MMELSIYIFDIQQQNNTKQGLYLVTETGITCLWLKALIKLIKMSTIKVAYSNDVPPGSLAYVFLALQYALRYLLISYEGKDNNTNQVPAKHQNIIEVQ